MAGYHEKKYSEVNAKSIDDEVRRIVDEAHDTAKKIIQERSKEVELMAQMLIEFETLDAEDVRKILTGEWTIEEKRERLKKSDDLHKKAPLAPPPSPFDEKPPITPAAPQLQPDGGA